jgi:hypothetical protein
LWTRSGAVNAVLIGQFYDDLNTQAASSGEVMDCVLEFAGVQRANSMFLEALFANIDLNEFCICEKCKMEPEEEEEEEGVAAEGSQSHSSSDEDDEDWRVSSCAFQ